MDYGTYYYGNRDADHSQAVILSTNCALDIGGLTTNSLFVQDSFEVQFACPHDKSAITTTTTAASATVIRTSALTQNGLDNPHVKVISPKDSLNLSIDYVSSPSLEARRLARQRISDSACRRYTQAIGQGEEGELVASQSTRRSKHHSPPTRLISSSRLASDFDLELPNLERSQPTLESMDTMTPEQKIFTKRGEQDYVQKKTFTNWMNTYLTKANPQIRVNDLFEEIRDGIVLIRLLEILSKETLPINITTDMKPAYCLSNVKTALDFLTKKKVKLVNINPVDIVEGRPKIVLGLIWVIILYFQIEEQEDMLLELLGIPKTGNRSKVTAKQALTTWVQNAFSERIERFKNFNIDIKDFGPSWRDGVAFNAIVHSIDPRLVDMREVECRSNRENLQRAFTLAEEKLGIPKILDPEDVDVERPDEKSIMTYVAQFYKAFPETGKPKSLNQCDREKQQFIEFLDALQRGESQLTESIQMNKNFNAAYPIYLSSVELVSKYDEFVTILRQNAEDGALVGGQYSPQTGLDAFNHFEERLKEWRWWLLERLPGELRQSGRWIVAAERWMDELDNGWSQNEEDGFPVPSDDQKLKKLIEEQNAIFGSDFHKMGIESSKLKKFLSKVKLEEAIKRKIEESMEEITCKYFGYVVTLVAANCYRSVLDAVHESGLLNLLEECAELASGTRPEESADVVQKVLDAYKPWENRFSLSEINPLPVAELTNSLNMVIQLEQSAQLLPPKVTSEVIGYWLQKTTDAFQLASPGGVTLQELGQRLEQRAQAWKTFATNLNAVVEHVDNVSNDLKANRVNIRKVKLNPIEEMLKEAESAAEILGTQTQLDSVARARRQFEEIKSAIEERIQEEVSIKEIAEQKVKDVLASISDWNYRAKGLMSDPDQVPSELSEKILAIQELLDETDELDNLLQNIEQDKPDALADSQIEEMDNIAADFFLHHRTLSDQLKNLEQITAKNDKIEGLLSKIEDMMEHSPMDFKELEESYNESVSDLTTSITELENLVRSAPVKILVQDLNFSHFHKRKMEFVNSWKNLCSSRRLEIHALEDFEEAYGKVDALMIELARYFDAIESDLSSENFDLIKSGITMFEDLIDTLNNRLPNDMGKLKEARKALIESISVGSNNEELKKTCGKRVAEMESKLDDLIDRKIGIEKNCNKASIRLQGFKKFTEILKSKVAEAKPQLALLKSGPKINGKSAKNDIDSTNTWHAECENLENLFHSSQNAASKLQTLLEDRDFKSPPECSEIFSEYHRLRDESKNLLNQAGVFRDSILLFKDYAKEIELHIQDFKRPAEKSRWGSRQSLRTPAPIDMSRRAEEIGNQLQLEEKVNILIQEMENCVQRINYCSFPPDLVQLLQKELDALKKIVELTFKALKAEQTELSKSLEVHSKYEVSLQSFMEWISLTEAQLKVSPSQADSIRENLQIQQEESTRLLNLYNEITSSGSQRLSTLLSTKEEPPDEPLKEQRRRLKIQYDDLVKAVSQERDICSKTLNTWKELDSNVRWSRTLLADSERKIQKVECDFEYKVESIKDAIQTASGRMAQSQRLIEEIDGCLEDFDKRLPQIRQFQQRNLPKSINLEEFKDLQDRRMQIKETRTELLSQLEGKRHIWTDLRESYKAFTHLLEQANSDILSNRPDYPSSANLRQLKQISETIESIRQKETSYATSVEDLRSRFSSGIDSKLAEMRRLCSHLGKDVEDLLEAEEKQAEEMKSKVEEIRSIQTEIVRKSLVLSTTFDFAKKIIEQSNEKLEGLIKSKRSRGPDDLLNEIRPLLTDLNQERQHLVDGFSSAVKDLQRAYMDPRVAPQFLGKLTESLQECLNEVSKRLDKVNLEVTAKATVMDDLCLEIQKEISSLEMEIEKISDLIERSDEISLPQEIATIQTKLKESEGVYSAAVARVKRIVSQTSKVKTSDRLHDLTAEASKMISECQSKLEYLKTTLKQITSQLEKLNKSISTAREAVNVNITAIQQNVQFRLPIRKVEELKKRLETIELLEEDLAVAEGTSIMEPPILNEDSLMPGIVSRFKDIQQYSDLFSTSFAEEVLTKLQSQLNIYRESLLKAHESLESAIEAADFWMTDSQLQLKAFQSVARDLESLDRAPTLDFESSQTARMEGLQKSKDLERSWLPQQIRKVDKLVRDASTAIMGAFSLSNIDEICERMEELQNFVNLAKAGIAKATLTWEAYVSEERELKQLSPMLEDIYDQLRKDIDDIEPRYRYASAEEAEEMLARLQRLKNRVPVGDKLSNKVRLILSSNPSALNSLPLLNKWESLSVNRLDSLVNAIEEVIAERTGNEHEIQSLQTWLEEFQHSVQQATIEAQSSSDIQTLNDNLMQFRSRLKQWENDCLEPCSRKSGAKEKLSALDGIRNSIQWQMDQLERSVKDKVNSQKIIEDRFKEFVREVDGYRAELESRNFGSLKGGSEATTALEVCDGLRRSRESLKNIYETRIETLFGKLYSFECDASTVPNMSEAVQASRKKLEGARKYFQMLDENLVSQIAAWEQVISLCKNIDGWFSDHDSKRIKKRRETNEFVAFPIEAFNKIESQRNMQRLETIAEKRFKEVDEARNRLDASGSVKELIEQLRKKTEGISEGKAVLKSMLENYETKLNEKIDIDQTNLSNAEKAQERIKKLQQAISNLDTVVLDCDEETCTVEEMDKKSENVQALLEAEIKPLVLEDFELWVQVARGERLFQMLQTRSRERQARDRLIASERESLKVLIANLRQWLVHWNKSLEEAKATADLELGIQLTATDSPTKCHCIENMKALMQEQQIKKGEIEEVERKRGSLILKELETEDSELIALIKDITSGERKANRHIMELSERCVRVEGLRGSLDKARDWIRSIKKRIGKFKNPRIGLNSLDEREDNLSSEDVEAVALELRQELNHSLSLLQASMEKFDNSGGGASLLQVALTEVDKIDSEIVQLLSEVSRTKANLNNYCVHSAGLGKLIQNSTEAVATNSSRLSDLLTRCLAGDRRIRSLSPLRVSTNRLMPQMERVILELTSLDDLAWLNGSDMLVQELRFIEADIKMNTAQFQSMVDQCVVLCRDYGDDSRSNQVNHLFQQNNQLLRVCEELIDHFSNVATQCTTWNSSCQGFVNWMDKQTVLISRLDDSSTNSAPTEKTLTELKTLQTELNTGIALQQAVADETQKMAVAVSRALHSANTTSAIIPITTPRVASRQGFDFSVNYRWHNSIMCAVTTLYELSKSLPTKINEYERRLAQWIEIKDRRENLVKWLEVSEQKVSESIKIIEDQGQGEGESAWGRQMEEMKGIETLVPSKKSELKNVETELLHSSSKLPDSALTDAFNKLNILEARLKGHLGFMNDIQERVDDFNRIAHELESWLRQYKRRSSQMDTEQGSNMIEHCRSILHEVAIRVKSRSRQRPLTWRLSDTCQILQDLSAQKSVAATFVCAIVRQYQSLEERFESMTKSKIPAKMSDKPSIDWQYFCRLLRQIQLYLDDYSAIIHGFLPTRGFDDANYKLGFARSTLARLEDFSVQLTTSANVLRGNTSQSPSRLSSFEIEQIVSSYDSSMLVTARETISRMEATISKLRSSIDNLQKLQNDWQNYNSNIDSFRRWLRKKTQSDRGEYGRSSVEEIKNEGDRLKSLQATFQKLSGNKSQSDPELEKLQTEYRRLLMQIDHRELSQESPREISEIASNRSLRTEVLSELLQTVRHIKSDVDQADRRADRSRLEWVKNDRAWRISKMASHCHICGRPDSSKNGQNSDIATPPEHYRT